MLHSFDSDRRAQSVEDMWAFAVIRIVLGVLSLRGARLAYIGFIALGLFYFPAKAGFRLDPHPCELAFNLRFAVHSLSNYAHIVLFALFFVLTRAQLRTSKWPAIAWATALTIAMGVLVEVAEGATGQGHCRLRDLIPDTIGAIAGSVVVLLLHKVGWTPNPSWSLVGKWRQLRSQHPALRS
jgi:hypothetical protein